MAALPPTAVGAKCSEVHRSLGWRSAFLGGSLIDAYTATGEIEAVWWAFDECVAVNGGQYGGPGWQDLPEARGSCLSDLGRLAIATQEHVAGRDFEFEYGETVDDGALQCLLEAPVWLLSALLRREIAPDAPVTRFAMSLLVLRTVGPLHMIAQSQFNQGRPALAGAFDDTAGCWAGLHKAVLYACGCEVPLPPPKKRPERTSHPTPDTQTTTLPVRGGAEMHQCIARGIAGLHCALLWAGALLERPLPILHSMQASQWRGCVARSDEADTTRSVFELVFRALVVCSAPEAGSDDTTPPPAVQALVAAAEALPAGSDDNTQIVRDGVLLCATAACSAHNMPALRSILASSATASWGGTQAAQLLRAAGLAANAPAIKTLLSQSWTDTGATACRAGALEAVFCSGASSVQLPFDVPELVAACDEGDTATLLQAAAVSNHPAALAMLRQAAPAMAEPRRAQLLQAAARAGRTEAVQLLLTLPGAAQLGADALDAVTQACISADRAPALRAVLAAGTTGAPGPLYAFRLALAAVRAGARACLRALVPLFKDAPVDQLRGVLFTPGVADEDCPGSVHRQAQQVDANDAAAFRVDAAQEAARGAKAVLGVPCMHWVECVHVLLDTVPELGGGIVDLLLRWACMRGPLGVGSEHVAAKVEERIGMRETLTSLAQAGRLDAVSLLLQVCGQPRAGPPPFPPFALGPVVRRGSLDELVLGSDYVQSLRFTLASDACSHGHLHVMRAVVGRQLLKTQPNGLLTPSLEELWSSFLDGCARAAVPRDVITQLFPWLCTVRVFDSAAEYVAALGGAGSGEPPSQGALRLLIETAREACIYDARGTPARLHALATCLGEVQVPANVGGGFWDSLCNAVETLQYAGEELGGVAAQAALTADDGVNAGCIALALVLGALHPELHRTLALLAPLYKAPGKYDHEWVPHLKRSALDAAHFADPEHGLRLLQVAQRGLRAFTDVARYNSTVQALVGTMYARLLHLEAAFCRLRGDISVPGEQKSPPWMDIGEFETGVQTGNWRLRRAAVLLRSDRKK